MLVVKRGQLDYQGAQECQEPRVLLVQKEMMAYKDLLVQLEKREKLALMVHQA